MFCVQRFKVLLGVAVARIGPNAARREIASSGRVDEAPGGNTYCAVGLRMILNILCVAQLCL